MENLRSKHDVELGVAMALLYFHGKAKMVDRFGVFVAVSISIDPCFCTYAVLVYECVRLSQH